MFLFASSVRSYKPCPSFQIQTNRCNFVWNRQWQTICTHLADIMQSFSVFKIHNLYGSCRIIDEYILSVCYADRRHRKKKYNNTAFDVSSGEYKRCGQRSIAFFIGQLKVSVQFILYYYITNFASFHGRENTPTRCARLKMKSNSILGSVQSHRGYHCV